MRRLSKLVGQLSISEEEEKPPNFAPRQDVALAPTVKSTLVLLGCGGTGKSSIRKAIFPVLEAYAVKLIEYIYENILNIPSFLLGSDSFGKTLARLNNQEFFKDEIVRHDLLTFLAKTSSIWNEDFAKKIYEMWWDPTFQNFIYSKRSTFAYMEAIHYFIKQREYKRLMKSDYFPSREDTFYCMIKTTGFVDVEYKSGYIVVDTGGQRTERRKWPSFLQHPEAKIVCFVVSLSEFNELCYEDDVTNRYEEGLSCWSTWYHHESIEKMPLYIIFNKMDVLERKVREGFKFSKYVPSYGGDDSDAKAISEFIIQRYLEIDLHYHRVLKHFVISANNFPQTCNVINEIFGIDERVSEVSTTTITTSLPKSSTPKPKTKKQFANSDFLIEDIIYNILEFMTFEELLSTYMLVSKKWAKVAFKIPIELFRPNMDNLINSRFENIKSLSLQSTFLQRRHIEQLAHNPMFKQLTYLNLGNNYYLSIYDWIYLFEHNGFKHLEKLAMDYCNLDSCSFLLKLPKLKEVSLKGNMLSTLDLKSIEHLDKEQSFIDPFLNLDRC